ncbi:GntR family transcriptional regulator [Saccharopolyspora erythraea NRRL 2338]|uniref:Transcriptional regulator, GntR family n=2 Tax=Saccharopolyspora erythraea TaxID=1836 RepID=A4FDW7_SACEN|nr:GntR family transcriptional regulator [Saccharopolyspora erythraea D]PFG95972.1 GntR family transcriptional regulator [Saccharopolyspora erythraea NRRL 2338]QRK92536.1 GntR family transcriptional regulator [Saccharopolyspora erythraea]CAM02242.1 transcriptional regulator, GntR family [Saccharopolyspora erythraea NRRL 2338]
MFLLVAVPAYLRIRTELEQQIQSGALPPGARLPTEAELQRRYSVGRATAQRVLTELAQAGLVERHRRRGTFVAEGARQENLLRLVNPTLRGPEIPGRHAVESATVVPAQDAGVDLPGVPDDTPVHQLRRLKFDSDDNPIAVELAAIPFSLAPRLSDEDLAHLTVHDYFAREGIPAAKSRVYVDPVLLDDATAARLRTEPGQAVIRLRRLTWLTGGELAEAMWHVIRPDLVEFFIEQSVLSKPHT